MSETRDIYCFHHDLDIAHFNDLVPLWCEVWKAQGWTPHVLTLDDAQPHPLFNALSARAFHHPTVNGRDFEWLCFMRWCAFAQVAGAVTDSDVFPRVPYPPRTYATPYSAEPTGGPGFLVGTAAHFTHLLHAMLTYEPRPTDVAGDPPRPHVSDMVVLQHDTLFARHHDIACYGVPEWQTRLLTHFGNAYMKWGDKVGQVRAVLREEGML